MSTTTNTTSTTKVYENVIYKGEPGTLTLTEKVFHYQANRVDASVKCSWARVERRQLSPPGAAHPMLKLILVSGRTTVFQVAETSILLELVQDVKARMETAASKKQEQALPLDNNDNTPAKSKRSSISPNDDDDIEAPSRRRRSSKPPVLPHQDEFLAQAHDQRDDSKRTVCYCCWDSLYCWLCIVASIVGVIGIASLVYFLAIQDNDSSSSSNCKEDPCPPDHGSEDRYGIRAVEYVWTPESVRLEYYISDYILTSSVSYTLYDGVDCRESQDQIVANDNEWIQVELVEGARGANLANEGKGTRQLDLVLSPRANSTLSAAPFYLPNQAASDRAFWRFCVAFQIHYNQMDDYTESIEVNYIENALSLNIDPSEESMGLLRDVQLKTVTRPEYKI